MARMKTEELKKHTLNLRDGDMEKLTALFPSVQSSVMVRKIISRFIDKQMAVREEQVQLRDDIIL